MILPFLAAILLFAIEWKIPLGYAVWLIYTFVLVGASWKMPRPFTYLLTGLCSALIALGFFFSPPGISVQIVLFNRSLAVLILLVICFILVRRKEAAETLAVQDRIKTGIARLNDVMRGDLNADVFGEIVVKEMCTFTGSAIGAFYLWDEKEQTLSFAGGYAYARLPGIAQKFLPGEGLVGQAAVDKKQILLNSIPADYIKITSGLGNAIPRALAVIPLLHGEAVKGVIEIGSLNPPNEEQLEYLTRSAPIIGANLDSAMNREKLVQALAQAQALAEELQMQQAELKASNEELESQNCRLRDTETELKTQQEKLESSNTELEEINRIIEEQKRGVERVNRELEAARQELEEKADQLEIAGRYKSEFLANMSHELRTPLNSILLLTKLLADNREGNLSPEQVESAEIVYKSGNDLLALIDDILDLSKIEVGKIELKDEKVFIRGMAENIQTGFQHLASEKGLELGISVAEGCPEYIISDQRRVEQILKNLVSNAIKFTDAGQVSIAFVRPTSGTAFATAGLDPENLVAVSVQDTGIGIQKSKQKIIFDAFQQIETGASRRYGGTGLGLSISRQLAASLGGEIQLQSEPGCGSTFTLYLPFDRPRAAEEEAGPAAIPGMAIQPVPPVSRAAGLSGAPAGKSGGGYISDDRAALDQNDQAVLIIEDDPQFARLLKEHCHEKALKCLAAETGEEGLEMARQCRPRAIILDLRLPGIDGWTVLERLKNSPDTRHIPVHIISVEEESFNAIRKGAVGFIRKPVKKEELDEAFRKLENIFSREIKDLLVIEDNPTLRKGIVRLIGNGDIHAEEASRGEEAIGLLRTKKFDCIVLDIGLPDMSGFEMLEKMEEENLAIPPVVVYTGRDLTREEENMLRQYSGSIIIKGARSEEGCSMRCPCSCTGWWAACRRRGARRSRTFMIRTPCSGRKRF